MGTKTVYQEAMRTKVRCPNCQKTMQARYLAYRHYCKMPRAEGELRQIGLRRLAALQERAVQILTPEKGPSLDPRLWDYVTSCDAKHASKVVDVRSALVARLGEADATVVLNGCTPAVTNNACGRSTRILRTPIGDAVKLKT